MEWLSEDFWQDLEGLINMNDKMKKSANLLKTNIEDWKNWVDLETPEDVELPSGLVEDLTPLEKLLIVREDYVFNVIKNFITNTTGIEFYITPPPE